MNEEAKKRYREYMESEEWAQKRERVLERAQQVCEGCLEQSATEVHHTTYAHVFNEFMFELQALCADCHQRWHTPPGQAVQRRQTIWEKRKSEGDKWRARVNGPGW